LSQIIQFSIVVFISSVISGTTGLGGGILLLSFMTAIFPPAVLIPLHGLIQLLSNSSRALLSLNRINYKIFILFTLGAGIGSLLGSHFTLSIPPLNSSLVLSTAILILTWMPKVNKNFVIKGEFLFVGIITSFASLFIGATGPLSAPFFLNSNLDKDSFVPTKSACQIPIHLFKVIVYMFSGFVLSQWTKEIMIAIPMVLLGNYIGKIFVGKFNSSNYRNIIKILITLLVLRMIIKQLI
jgi:uncharacterized protein